MPFKQDSSKKTGEAHPLDMMYRKKFLEAKKMAYGGKIADDEELPLDDYDEDEETSPESDTDDEGTRSEALMEADEKPDEDADRLAFARRYRTSRAMRK